MIMKAITLIIFLFLTKTCLADKYEYFLPMDQDSEEILKVLKSLKLDDKSLKHLRSVNFTSGESYDEDGGNVINKIYLIENENIDIWHMKQILAKKIKVDSEWDNLLIIVDKRKERAKSYYFQLEKGKHIEKPKPIGFTAMCFSCHVSGPRKIRPQKSKYTNDLTKVQMELISSWNNKIENYKNIDTYFPSKNKKFGFVVPNIAKHEKIDFEELKMNKCSQCHGKDSHIRGALFRQHSTTIKALIENGPNGEGYYSKINDNVKAYMPHGNVILSEKEMKCIKKWISGKNINCNFYDEKNTIYINPKLSWLQTKVKTKLHDIKINKFDIQGKLKCIKKKCMAKFEIDLTDVETGASLRNYHLLNNVLENKFLKATFKSEVYLGQKKKTTAQLNWKNKYKDIKIEYNCLSKTKCQYKSKLSLSDFGIKNIGYFGLYVKDEVEINGEITFL